MLAITLGSPSIISTLTDQHRVGHHSLMLLLWGHTIIVFAVHLHDIVCIMYMEYVSGLCSELVHDEDLTLGFVRLNNLPALHAVQINNGQEYILCFNGTISICSFEKFREATHPSLPAVVGVYVNQTGRRSRKQELLWHSSTVLFR